MININGKNDFEKEVMKSSVPVIVDFYADWCGPCKMQMSVLNDLSSEIEGKGKICKINVDQNSDLAAEYAVQSIPTLLIISDGKVKKTLIGLQSKEVLLENIKA